MFESARTALGWMACAGERADLWLSDINMPGMNGIDLLRNVKRMAPDMPFILVSGLCDLPMAQEALRAGATDYLLKPVDPEDLLGMVARHFEVSDTERLARVKEALRQSLGNADESGGTDKSHVLPILDLLRCKRFDTLQHSQRVTAYSLLIARQLNLEPRALRGLEVGALLHDIGKAAIPHNVLMKAGPLNAEEWSIMMMHPRLGLDLLVDLPGLELEAQIVYSHHERFDGTGYPEKLAGEDIPLNARIFAVADTLDALTSDRCYRKRRPLGEARAEIHRSAGSQFDPAVLALFDQVPDTALEAVRERFPDAA
jgi:response regulator RpfG family c-di-GMP phosphodiesterase